MVTKHTPGPWLHSCDEGAHGGCNINAMPEGYEDGVVLAEVQDLIDFEEADDEEADEAATVREANARLMAAAPDLLAALEAIASARLDGDKCEGPEVGGSEHEDCYLEDDGWHHVYSGNDEDEPLELFGVVVAEARAAIDKARGIDWTDGGPEARAERAAEQRAGA